LRRDDAGGKVLVVSNFTPVVRTAYRLGVDDDGVRAWRVALDTDASGFGGSGLLAAGRVVVVEPVAAQGRAFSIAVDLPPLSTLFLVPA
jgi:1,4-alpha-glucan branching enzyme